MFTVSRRGRFVTAAGAALAASAMVRAGAKAAQFDYKLAHDLPVEHPVHVRMVQLWDVVKAQTGGRLDVKIYPNSILGGQSAMLTQVRLGAIQFFPNSSSTFSDYVPLANIDGVGFAFSSPQQAWKVMEGPLGDYVRNAFAARGLYVIPGKWELGMRQVTSSTRPIRSVEDFAGFKIRVPAGNLSVDLFRTLGAAPMTTPSSEIYTTLQTHVADGQESPVLTIETFKIYEVQRYLSMTNHAWNGFWFVANAEAWKALPTDIQAVVERNAATYRRLELGDATALSGSTTDKLRRQGLATSVVDGERMRARLGPYYARAKAEFGATAWGLLEAGVGKLG